MTALDSGSEETIDVAVVGAGFAGLYCLHAFRKAGYKTRVYEAAPEIGGTWYWNRYPGCRCDIESMQYSFQFDEDLQQEWTWTERYASQPEILSYINHVADRLDLRRDITLSTKVAGAQFDDNTHSWSITTVSDAGEKTTVDARYLVLGVGVLSTTHVPAFVDQELFDGPVFHTARWPEGDISFAGKRVGVIGTGSSAIQAIPHLARQAEELFVFQRTPNYVTPARNRELSAEEVKAIKDDYPAFRAEAKKRPSAFLFPFNPGSALDDSEEERLIQFEKHWEIGGLPFLGAYGDILFNQEANNLVIDYWQSKVRAIVDDPEVAELLIPKGDIFGGKRLCAGTDYFETYNRDNVTLVDVSDGGIERFTEAGLRAAGQEFDLDAIVCATGFDAMTGSVVRIDIVGPDGTSLREKWGQRPDTFLGLAVHGFPNLFNLTGPGCPGVFATMVTGIEHQGDWLVDCFDWMQERGHTRIEASLEAEQDWVAECDRVAQPSLRTKCDSWYMGSNIEGKPRVFMPYIGGFPAYVEACQTVSDSGYEGFDLT